MGYALLRITFYVLYGKIHSTDVDINLTCRTAQKHHINESFVALFLKYTCALHWMQRWKVQPFGGTAYDFGLNGE